MVSPTKEQCDQLLNIGGIPKPDPDISGIGVLIAFILSAYMTFAFVLLAYIFGMVEENLLNQIDRRIFKIKPYNYGRPRMHIAIRKVVLALGDQQIVTGIAILGAAFQGLRNGSISVYHYQIAIYLAWMSSSVHLSAVTVLGDFLTKNKGLMVWRVAGMLVLLAMLIIGLVPTVSNDWAVIYWNGMLPEHTGYGLPATCFWGQLYGDGLNADSIIGLLILFSSYMWKMGGLSSTAGKWYNYYIRASQEGIAIKLLTYTARKCRGRRSIWWRCAYRASLAITLPLFAVLEMLASFAASLWLSGLGLVFGSMQVFIPRLQNIWYTETAEQAWTFGQLLPLILLVVPLATISEHIWPEDNMGSCVARNVGISRQLGHCLDDVSPDCDHSLHRYLVRRDKPDLGSATSVQARVLEFLYESRLFAAIVWLLQCSIVATAAVVFELDAYSIGYYRGSDWQLFAVSGGACIGAMWIFVLAILPFSRLGKLQ